MKFYKITLLISYLYLALSSQFSLNAMPVGNDGSLNKIIPIKAAPGRVGIQPNLALTYNSNAGNGMVGMGWQLTGLAPITRINYGNGINYDVNDTFAGPNGRLILVDEANAIYHSANEDFTKYVPYGDDDNLWKPTTSNGCGNGPCYWQAELANGKVMFFGGYSYSANEGRIESAGSGTSVRVWALSRVNDLHGNVMLVKYDKDATSSAYYPESIFYTLKEGSLWATGGVQMVDFIYESRTDTSKKWPQNAAVQIKQRLVGIEILTDGACVAQWCGIGSLIRRYDLNYEYSSATGRSRLTSIQESDGGSNLRPAISFTYQEQTSFIEDPVSANIAGTPLTSSDSAYKLFVGDFNGDGLADLLRAGTFPGSGTANHLWHSSGSSFVSKGYILTSTTLVNYNQYGLYVGDFNGDGRDDLLRVQKDATSNASHLFFGTASGFGYVGEVLPNTLLEKSDRTYLVHVKDFNGDGRADILRTANDASKNALYLSNGTSFTYQYGIAATLTTNDNWMRLHTYDITGDGKVDIFRTSDTIAHNMFWQPGATAFDYINPFPVSAILTRSDNVYNIVFGDFNADGRADFFRTTCNTATNSGDSWLSTGNSFVGQGYNLTSAISCSSDGSLLMRTTDFNGDGKADLLRIGTWSSELANHIWVSNANGSGFEGKYTPNIYNAYLYSNDNNYQFHQGDFNGDGRVDFIRTGNDGNVNKLWLITETPTDKMISMDNGIGLTTNIQYELVHEVSNAIQEDVSSCNGIAGTGNDGYGYACGNANKYARYLVTEVEITDGVEDFTTSYEFENGRVYLGSYDKVANLGFGQIKTTNEKTGDYTVRKFYQTKPFQGQLMAQESYLANNTLVAETTVEKPTQYACDETGCTVDSDIHIQLPRQFRPGKTTQKQYRLNGTLLLTVENEVTSFDSYGVALESKTTRTGNGVTQITYSSQKVITRLTNPRVIGLPYETCKSVSALLCDENNSATYDSILSYNRTYYDSQTLGAFASNTKPLVTKSESWIGGTNWAGATNTYTTEGNLATTTDAQGVVTTYTYESNYKTFVESTSISSDSVSFDTTFQIDEGFGIPESTTDAAGLITTANLDAFGRATSTTLNDGSDDIRKSSVDYPFDDSGSGYADNFKEECAHYGGTLTLTTCSRTYFDKFGRKIKEVTPAVDGSVQKFKAIDYSYDSNGRLSSVTQPYFTNTIVGSGTPSANNTTFTYDAMGRRIKVTRPDGKFSEVFYEDVSLIAGSVSVVTSKDAEGVSKRTFGDINGNPFRVIEAVSTSEQATVDYTYNQLGLLTEVSAPQGNTDITYYQGTNFQASITTPNAGTTDYTYYTSPGNKNFGQLNVETRPDPNSSTGTVTVTHEYNASFGRLSKQTYSDGSEASFTYDQNDNIANGLYGQGKGMLTTSSYTSDGYTIQRQYKYDILGQEISQKQTIAHSSQTLCSISTDLPCEATIGSAFDDLGRKTTINYPDSKSTTISYYGSTTQVASISHDGTTYATYSNYNVNDQVGQINFANNVQTNYTYSATTGLMTNLTTTDANSQELLNYDYAFDDVFNVTTVTDNVLLEASYTYSYDNLYRLQTSKKGSAATLYYGFDSRGNLTTKANTTTAANLTYTAGKTKVSLDGVNAYAYSAAGNMITKGANRSYSYDLQNMLRTVINSSNNSTTDNYYDEGGQRFLKVYTKTGDPTIKTYYFGAYEIREKWNGSTFVAKKATKYILGLDGKQIAAITDSGYLGTAYVTPSAMHYAAAQNLGSETMVDFMAKSYHTFMGFVLEEAHVQTLAKVALALLLALTVGFYLRFILGFGLFKAHQLPKDLKYLFQYRVKSYTYALGYEPKGKQNTRFITQAVAKRPVLAQAVFFTCIVFGLTFCSSGRSNSNDSLDFLVRSSFAITGNTSTGLPPGTFYYHGNHLGSASVVTDESGDEVMRINYKPYGEIDQTFSGKLGCSNAAYTTKATCLANSATWNHIYDVDEGANAGLTQKFTGQEYDPENELYYYNGRYYDPSIGNFTTPDTYIDGNDTLMGYNRYAYVAGNPIKYTDPSGNFGFIAALIVAGVSAVAAGTANAVAQGKPLGKIDFGQVFKAAGIGALAGLTGYGAGAGIAAGVGATAGAIGGASAATAIAPLGTVLGAAGGGAIGGATGTALTLWDACANSGNCVSASEAWGHIGNGSRIGAIGGLVAGSALISNIPVISGFAVSAALGSAAAGAESARIYGGNPETAYAKGFGTGFLAGWATGILNREFNLDGQVEYSKGKRGYKLSNLNEGDIVGFQSHIYKKSTFNTVKDWLWSTMVGGYSHVSGVSEGEIAQYGKVHRRGTTYKGRGFKVLGNTKIDVTATSLHPGTTGKNSYYNEGINNCSTSLSKGFGGGGHWAPYNIYSHFNMPQYPHWNSLK